MKKIGSSSIEVSSLCFGGNVFGWTVDEKKSFELLDLFVGNGFNFIDTADVYSAWVPGNKGGESEVILGHWMKSRKNRDKIVLATKVGSEMGPGKKGLAKKYIYQAVEDSLKRLQTDYIDLYQSHWDDPETPQEETLQAYTKLIEDGKVRIIGASNHTAERLASALEISKRDHLARYQCLQPLYNLYDRKDFEDKLEPLCKKEHIGVISYYSLASGFLTGKYRTEADISKSPRGAGIAQKYLNERGLKILSALDKVADELNSTPGEVALAWLMAHPTITAPIASATTPEQLKDLMKAAKLKLSPAALDSLNHASK